MNREKIIGRIRALLSKTVHNGCTEDEAISAAAKAAEMLIQYDLTLDDISVKKETVTIESNIYYTVSIWKVAGAISDLTGCKYWKTPTGILPMKITFIGFEHAVEISHYLMSICQRAITAQQDRHPIH